MKMKRIIALLLVLCSLFALCACQNGDAEVTTETRAPAVQTNVAEPLTWEKINAIPIANNDMTEEELRQICVDFMQMTMSFQWTPSVKTDFTPKGVYSTTFEYGKVYGGTPYIAGRVGNIYTMMEYYDERNGMMDLSGGMETIEAWANQCSGSVFWAWNRVCTSIGYTNTTDCLQSNGCLRVGPYTYSDDLFDLLKQNMDTINICMSNGLDVMSESYALMKPADGIVQFFNGAGHVRMISGYPNVVRDANGKIDPIKSTVVYTDQDSHFYQETMSNGIGYERAGGFNKEVTFVDLFNTSYIPFTFAELNKDKPIDKPETTFSHTEETINIMQLMTASVKCNYSISDVTIVIKDAKGNQVYRDLTPTYNFIGVQMHDFAMTNAIVSTELVPFADGKHTIEISARIGTGEKPVIYSGTFVG